MKDHKTTDAEEHIISKIFNQLWEMLKKIFIYSLNKVYYLLIIVTEKTAYDKVIINFFLTFIIPFLLLNMPIAENQIGFTEHWFDGISKQLQQGLLFSTTMSIAATYISTYISRVNDINREYSSPKSNKLEGMKGSLEYIANYSNTLFWALSILLVSAIFLGISKNSSDSMNLVVISFQIILYLGILITYGHSEQINRDRSTITKADMDHQDEIERQRMEKEKINMPLSDSFKTKHSQQEG